MKNTYLLAVIIAILVGAGGFFAGMQYQKMQRIRFGQANGVAASQFVRRAGGAGGVVMGEILSKDDTSLTVKMPDGSSKIVILSGSTSINKQASGSASDLKTGEKVAVFGAANADGSVTAQNIQLNPQMRVGIFGQRGTPAK